MPKMKTHQLTKYTGAVKNFYGVIPGSGKAAIHQQAPTEESLSQAVVDIYSALKPQLAVMDGIVGMEGEGAENISKVAISETDCKRCGICIKSCPASAITLEPRPLIDQEKCIKCYCCHELCSNSAVKLKTSFLGRQLLKTMQYNKT